MTLLFFIAGFALLFLGAEWLVRGASRVAAKLSVSPLVIGLTVVAFGTSMPEMAAGAVAAWAGSTDIVLGNVLGSNVANVGLILGLSAIIRSIPVRSRVLRREIPLMLAITLVVYGMCATGSVGFAAGLILVVTLLAITWLALRWAQSEQPVLTTTGELERMERDLGLATDVTVPAEALRIVAGLAALSLGADWLVDSAVALARQFAISEFLISVSLVALGTSLPELAASIAAARQDESELLVGNIVGSNIFNLSGALGVAAMVRTVPVGGSVLSVDFPVVIGFSLAMYLFLHTARSLVRWEGVVLLAGYLAYISWLFA